MLKYLSSIFFGLNSAGHLLHKTNPDLSYFELNYVFWEHNDSVVRGTTEYSMSNCSQYREKLTSNAYRGHNS